MIDITYGPKQQFRYRHGDINLLGRIEIRPQPERSDYRLNGGPPTHFYVEPEVPRDAPGIYPYGCKTPSCHRFRDKPGAFNIEIPINDPLLRPGGNQIEIETQDRSGYTHRKTVDFDWDPRPVPLPLDLTDLSRFQSIQEFAQVVDGAFDLDSETNVIRSRSPVGSDVLLLLGSPHQSQEATFTVKFSGPAIFMGVSDFFAGHMGQASGLGIKPGYSTAGLATINRSGTPQVWLSVGDNLVDHPGVWVLRTDEARRPLTIQFGAPYRVRHQTLIGNDLNCSRFKIWPEATAEPEKWLCEEHTRRLSPKFSRIKEASFGLFQYFGTPTEWSDIRVRALEIDFQNLDIRRTHRNYPRYLSWRLRNGRARIRKTLKSWVRPKHKP